MTDKEIRSGEADIVQKQTDDALRESERRYRMLFENMTTGVALHEMVYDEQGNPVEYRFLDANQAFEQQTGLSVVSILGRAVLEVLPGMEQRRIETYAKVVQTGTPVLFEEYSSALGKWFETRAFRTATNQFATIFTDITDRKQMEEKLRISEFDLRRAQAVAHVGSWRWDIASDELSWSDEMCRIFGIARHAFTGSWWDVIAHAIHPDDRVRVEKASRAVIEDHNPQSLEYRIVRPDGSVRTIWDETGEMTLDDKGHAASLTGIVLDITGRTKLEQEVAHLALFPAQNPYPVLEVGTDGAVRFANAAAMATLERLGLDPDARQFLPGAPEDLVLLRSQCEQNPQTQELHLGKATFLRVVASPPGNDSLHVYVLDITERKQAEEALRQSEAKYRLLIDTASESIVVVQDGLLKFVNLMTLAVLGGYSEQELINRPFPEFVHPDDRSMVVENYRRRIANEAEQPPPRYAFRVISRDGIVKWVEINAALIEWQGKPATLNFLTDITERKRVEEALLQARDDWESTFDSLTDMVTIHDKNYDIIRANSSARQMLGLPLLGNLITKAKCFMCYHGTEKPPEGCPSCRSLVTEQPGSFELFEPHLNRYLEIRAIPRFDTHHQCIGLVHVVRDITERKQAEEEILRERAFFDQLIETAPEGIAITDTQGRVMRVNAEFVRMFGYGVDEAVGQDIDDLVAPPALDAEARGMTTSSSHGETKFLETVRRRKDDTLVDVSVIAAPVLIAGKQEANYAIYRDITERKQMEQKLEEMATHDFLTGLPNRALLLDRFTIAAALARRNKSRLAVISLDLDKFKSVNDTLGHDAGDQVLKTIGIRLTRIVRASDTFARVGGDEFISVMLGTSRIEDASVMAQKILDSFREPVSVGEHQLHLSTSIGIAIYPDDGDDLETLTKKSDAAMYYSKGHGGNQLKFYRDGDAY